MKVSQFYFYAVYLLTGITSLGHAKLFVRNATTDYPPASPSANGTRHTILVNDWGSTAFIPFLLALVGGMEVLGLASDTANTWVDQTTLHAGSLPWQGAFDPENLIAQAEGNDPTRDDPSQISKSAFIEGYPNTTALEGYTAAQYMIEQVHRYPGKVSIYSAGALTNIATVIRLDSTFASTAKELIVMGGYVDLNLYQLQSALAEDIGSDINFLIDPEAAHIAVTAPFPSITIAGNVANQQYLNQSLLSQIVSSSNNPYAQLMKDYDIEFPLWDETAAAIMAFPELVTNKTIAYMDVNTAFDSPDYGRAHLWSELFATNYTRSVNYVLGSDQEAFFEKVASVVMNPGTCPSGTDAM